MENYFFLLLIAVVGAFRLFAQIAEKKRNADAERRSVTPPSSAPPPRSNDAQTEEERVRKFFEALGVPASNAPAPKVEPRRVVTPKAPPKKFMPIDPFPVPRGSVMAPLPPPVVSAPPPIPSAMAPATTARPKEIVPPIPQPAAMMSQNFEVQSLGESDAAGPSLPGNSFAARLVNPQGLRDAMVLREIFGPPRSQQPFSHSSL
ncbi:MAG: hypothetical protein ACR2NX_16900 [Chthoniobacterales bacterium]